MSGARRAASVICKELRLVGPGTEEWLAEIIERETACGELLAALKLLADVCGSYGIFTNYKPDAQFTATQAMDRARAAIRKGGGRRWQAMN